ncbi:hypothetical protein ABK040_014110 [Willaertia magna]
MSDLTNKDLDVRNVEEGYEQREGQSLPGGRERGQRESFDEIINDPNYEIKNCHKNKFGDYTVVFHHKSGGNDQTFANVKGERIPSKFISD